MKTGKKNRWKKALAISAAFFVFFLVLGILRGRYNNEHENVRENAASANPGFLKNSLNPLPKKWKYYAGEIKDAAEKNFNDKAWSMQGTALYESDSADFRGICWFRTSFRIHPSLVNKIMALKIVHLGASEIYLDGKMLCRFGKVSADAKKELTERPPAPVIFSVGDTSAHVLAIHYSNHNYMRNLRRFQQELAGIQMSFDPQGQKVIEAYLRESESFFWIIAMFVFFVTLGIIHFLLYLFYRKQIANLYYAIYVFLFAYMIYALYSLSTEHDPETFLAINYYFFLVMDLFLFSVLNCIYSLFKPSLWKRMLVIQAVLCIICPVLFYIPSTSESSMFILLGLVLFTCIEAVRSVIYAMMKKQQGAAIIGTGVLTFFIFIFILLIEVFITSSLNFEVSSSNSAYFVFLIIFCLISIPLSMSIYLAWSSANTNRSLEQKLNEVEELSAKTIEQEKEKQSILENQNSMLEVQVNERTLEIREQKKVIEEKNKDIIDSINYAKRIQAAMLPDESMFKSVFSDSFILYQPRDIVSGDFYYATEIDEKKLLLAADCTGHGVPGALMSMVGSNIINKLVHENNILDPKQLLEKLHEQLRYALKQDQKGSVNRDGMDVAVVMIDGDSVTYAGANRPLVYFDSNKQLQEVKPTKTPVGGSHIESISIDSHILEKKNIYELFLFSDGFADQFGGPDGKKLMVSKFKAWLSQIVDKDPNTQLSFLSQNFSDWKNNTEQVDDVMVIGIKLK